MTLGADGPVSRVLGMLSQFVIVAVMCQMSISNVCFNDTIVNWYRVLFCLILNNSQSSYV